MITLVRTHSGHHAFQKLIAELDRDLALKNGAEHDFFAAHNTTDQIRKVVLACQEEKFLGCGAVKDFAPGVMEIKRMFVLPECRGQGIASSVLQELEQWSRETGAVKCVLETGLKMPEAIALYQKHHYRRIPNYGPYAGVESSVCFEKKL